MRYPPCLLVVLAAVLLSPWASAVRAATPWVSRHGITYEDLLAWIKEEKGYRLEYLNGFDAGGHSRFSARLVKNDKHYLWYWCAGPLASIQQMDAERRPQGFRVVSVSGFLGAGSPKFAAVWVKDGVPAREKRAFNLTKKEYEERIILEKKNNFMPQMVTGYADGAGSYRFTVLFVPAEASWREQHDLTEEDYQTAVEQQTKAGRRPRCVTVYPTAAGLRFAAVFVKEAGGWSARHDMSAEEYQEEFARLADEFYPLCIAGYQTSESAGLELFDAAMNKYMKQHRIPAGTLAVSRDGKLLMARGYGFADAAGHRRIDADDPMRLASLVKPITAAAIRTLFREGKLSRDAKAFPLLGLKPPPGHQSDPRLNDITIEHLLEHKGGWDRDKAFDPMARPLKVAAFLKVPGPIGPVDMIRYMMAQPLQFAPGARESYSNFGYCVLGRVIEKVSGETYPAYVQKHIFAPLGVRGVELGRTLPRYRNPREPGYHHPGKGRNVVEPQSQQDVPIPDGGFYLEMMDSHGGLIASSRDYVRFLDAYWISGEPRQGKGRAYVHFGRLAGTFTVAIQRPNGVNVAAFFNQDEGPARRNYAPLRNLLTSAADRQSGSTLNYAAIWEKSE